MMKRKEPHIYVANWFYLGFIVTIAVLHLGNNVAVPISILSPKSYVVWSRRAGCDVPVVVRP